MAATPQEAHLRSKRSPKIPSFSSTTPKSDICSSLKQNILLEDWWLIKADSDSKGRRLGVGGYTFNENLEGIIFLSAPILKRIDAVTLTTVDGKTIMVSGLINRSRTLENGFSHETCDHFVIGFPYCWEEFVALSVDEEPGNISVSTGFFGSDVHIMPPDNRSIRDIFNDIMQQVNNGDSTAKKESDPQAETKAKKAKRKGGRGSNAEVVECSGRLTRSRSRKS